MSVAAADVLPYLADTDLVKMDIEGGEWEILADPRLGARLHQALVLGHHGRHWAATTLGARRPTCCVPPATGCVSRGLRCRASGCYGPDASSGPVH